MIIAFTLLFITASPAFLAAQFLDQFEVHVSSKQIPEERFKEVYNRENMFGGGFSLTVNIKEFKFSESLSLGVKGVAGLDYFSKKGKMTLSEEPLKLDLIYPSVGAQVVIKIKKIVEVYGRAGLGPCFYKEKFLNDRLENVSGSNLETYLGGGLIIHFSAKYSAVLDFKQTKLTADPSGVPLQLGGPRFSVGLGYDF